MDIRLEEIPFEFEGKTYKLRCNMNVLADVQEIHGGDLLGALRDDSKGTKVGLEFLTAMLNDYADEMGWEERFTVRQVGRKFRPKDLELLPIFKLIANAVFEKKPEEESEEESKN